MDINDDALEVIEYPAYLPTHFTCHVCNKNRHMNDIDVLKWYSSDDYYEWTEKVLHCSDSDECKRKAKQCMLDDKERVAYFGEDKP